MIMVLEKSHNDSAKSPDFSQDNEATKKKFFSKPYTTTRIKSQNSYPIFHMLVQIKRIFTTRTLYLTFTRFWQKI